MGNSILLAALWVSRLGLHEHSELHNRSRLSPKLTFSPGDTGRDCTKRVRECDLREPNRPVRVLVVLCCLEFLNPNSTVHKQNNGSISSRGCMACPWFAAKWQMTTIRRPARARVTTEGSDYPLWASWDQLSSLSDQDRTSGRQSQWGKFQEGEPRQEQNKRSRGDRCTESMTGPAAECAW